MKTLEAINTLTITIACCLKDGTRVDGAVQQLCHLVDDEIHNDESSVFLTNANIVIDEYFNEYPDFAF